MSVVSGRRGRGDLTTKHALIWGEQMMNRMFVKVCVLLSGSALLATSLGSCDGLLAPVQALLGAVTGA